MVALCAIPLPTATGQTVFAGRASRRNALRVRATAETATETAAEAPAQEVPQPVAAAAAPAAAAPAAAAPKMVGKVVKPHPARSTSQYADVLEVMSFNGVAPELINGRLAMLGFLAAFGCEVFTHQPVLFQFGAGFKTVAWCFNLVAIGSLVPIFKKVENDEAFGPLTPEIEMFNGRAAMVGIGSMIVLEAFKGASLF